MNDYGFYQKNIEGELVLQSVDEEIPVKEYRIADGTAAIARDAFFDVPFLEKIYIPVSLKEIPDGSLSNGGNWPSEEKGIVSVDIASGNPYFKTFDCFFCRKKEDLSYHLIRALEIPEHTIIPQIITTIGEGAFAGRYVESITLEKNGARIWFPSSHRFYLEVLLGKFGKNGKLFDFKEYDRLLLFDHFNPERIRMLCERLAHPIEMEEGYYEKIRQNALDHLEDIMEAVVKNGDTDLLEMISDNNLFTEENIDTVMEQVARTQRKDLMFWLMEYKNSRFGIVEEDLFI